MAQMAADERLQLDMRGLPAGTVAQLKAMAVERKWTLTVLCRHALTQFARRTEPSVLSVGTVPQRAPWER